MAPRSFRGVSMGALGQQAQVSFSEAISQLEITDAQVYNEIAEAMASGVDESVIDGYNAQYDALLDRLITQREAGAAAGDADAASLLQDTAAVQDAYDALLTQLQSERGARQFGVSSRGLVWGLGVAAVSAGVLWWTWTNRQR